MKVLVVGGGGREHAICWKLAQSPRVTELFCAPGNAGIAQVATCVPIKATDVEGMVKWAKENAMDFVMVAPDPKQNVLSVVLPTKSMYPGKLPPTEEP